MSKHGRPRKCVGSAYQRSNSNCWWIRNRDREGELIKESSGVTDKEAERLLRDRLNDLDNGIIHIADSNTANGVADMPMTVQVSSAFERRTTAPAGSEPLFPTNRASSKPYIGSFKKAWAATLKRASVEYFSIYELRHTFATRLSAGGVADHFVTQMLRQGDSAVFKRYSQAKLNMMREALGKLDRRANEHSLSYLPR